MTDASQTTQFEPDPTLFAFSCEKQYTPQEVASLVHKHGTNIVIGGDPGWGDDFDRAMTATRQLGAKRHVYLFGPGMWEWSREERDQMRRAANSVGIGGSGWRTKWYAYGWREHLAEQLRHYNTMGFYSAEVDNLDAVFKSPAEWINFYRWFARLNLTIKIVPKNLSRGTLHALVREIGSSQLDDRILAPFAIFEAGTGNVGDQSKQCANLHMTAITPKNGLLPTDRYATIRTGVPLRNFLAGVR